MTKEFFERGKQIAEWADKNTTKDEALKMAIKHLSFYAFMHFSVHHSEDKELLDVIMACQEALEQPKPSLN